MNGEEESNIAFGYVNLNNDLFAEWGYIGLNELLSVGVKLDENLKSCRFKDAIKRIGERRKR